MYDKLIVMQITMPDLSLLGITMPSTARYTGALSRIELSHT